jgi:hypothetical protein
MITQPATTTLSLEERITAAFKAMRKEGVAARQNYLATGSDAMKALDDQVRASHRRNKFTGAVYYSRADNDGETLTISYNRVPSEATLDAGPLAALASKHLRAAGVVIDWSGDTAHAIRVNLDQ